MVRPKKIKDEKSKWDKPKKYPNKEVVRKLVGNALEILILTVMGSHMYQFNGQSRLQLKGGATGLELTGELSDLIMLWWDEEFLRQLKNLSVEVGLYTRFKDDLTVKLKDSGYSVKNRKEIIVNANKIFQLQCERDEKGIKPLFRPREMILTDRKNKKGQIILGGR